MRTDSSPSVISISAMPDSSSSSMSFLTLRMSMHVPRVRLERDSLSGLVLALRCRRRLLQAAQRRGQGQLIADGAAARDAAHGDVGEIGMAAEVLAPVGVADVHFDEGQ